MNAGVGTEITPLPIFLRADSSGGSINETASTRPDWKAASAALSGNRNVSIWSHARKEFIHRGGVSDMLTPELLANQDDASSTSAARTA